jgi:hypothetical protein
MDEENMTTELDSSLPAYSEEECSQLDDMYVKSPSVDLPAVSLYTPPTRSSQPAFIAGPSMCIVRCLFFNPALTSIK